MQINLKPVFVNKAPSSTLAINEDVQKRWASGKRVLHMGFGESRFAVHEKLQRALQAHACAKSYMPSQGLPELREAVAAYYSDKHHLLFNADQVLIGPGSKALIYALQLALDADLFLPSPSWVSYAPQAELLGSRIFYVPSRVDDGYSFDLKAFAVTLEQSSNPNKLLILNSPNNPTGHMWSESSLRELAEFCREHKILVISDEIYFLVEHGDIKHNSLAKYYPQGTFILGGLSKHLSIGGWRVGVALLPDSESGKLLMQAVKVIASEIWSSVAAPIQYAALQAYSHDPEIEAYIKTCSRIHGIRTKFLYQKLTELGISCTKPLGAFYLTANFDAWADPLREIGVESSAQLARYLLDQHDLATLSTDAFGIPEKTLSLRLATSYLDMEKDEDSQRLTSLLASGMSEQEFMSEANHPNTHAAIGEFEKFVERCNDAYTNTARAF